MKKKYRVIVRQWVPRKIPYAIPKKTLQMLFSENKDKLKQVVYVGWKRNTVNNKRVLQFVISTGATSSEARHNFKKLGIPGETLWIVT